MLLPAHLQSGDFVRLDLGSPELGALLLPAAATAGGAPAQHPPSADGESRPASEAGAQSFHQPSLRLRARGLTGSQWFLVLGVTEPTNCTC